MHISHYINTVLLCTLDSILMDIQTAITFPASMHLVSITTVTSFFSQIILQKSLMELGMGPWAAM